jgi:hypothetical protein
MVARKMLREMVRDKGNTFYNFLWGFPLSVRVMERVRGNSFIIYF